MILDDLKHAQRERLIFLDRCLTWRGLANRRDLVERFGISMAQAALDFRTYIERSETTPPIYFPSRKSYMAAPGHRALDASSLTEAFDVVANEEDILPSAALPRPERKAEPEIVAKLFQSMRAGTALRVRYTSMTSNTNDEQWLIPTRFISDGESVYARAFSYKHETYRNYLPIRFASDSSFEEKPLNEPPPHDEDWNTKATIWLRPKAGLTDAQLRVVRREFGLEGETLRIEIRKALEFFFNRRWGLDLEGARLERLKTEYTPLHYSPPSPAVEIQGEN